MATQAQIAANRKNAQASTGPKTVEGKARASQNAVSLGLFTKQNWVRPHEQEEYDTLYNALWNQLSPIGPMEEMFATEIIRGAWRSRRCVTAENDLLQLMDDEARRAHDFQDSYRDMEPYSGPQDPMLRASHAQIQIAIDRARAQATGSVRRATAELRRLQTERLFRAATLPENTDPASFGLAAFAEVMPQLQNEAKARLLTVITPAPAEPEAGGHAAISRVAEITNQTESAHHRPAEAIELLQSAA
ncbi:MAG: hypothetical protein ABSB15_26695 [Bryobacteraceae bacterium]|jgi:hypothetical protein